jgi:nicotinate dehydrogenase subunit B
MYAAVVADVEVDRRTGTVRGPQVVIAADVGCVINPDGAVSQLEGGIVQAVSLSLKEQVTFDRRSITTRDWSDYPILILVGRSDDPPLGAGEGSLAPATAAVANAFADATGRRLRLLPMTPDRVKAALT